MAKRMIRSLAGAVVAAATLSIAPGAQAALYYQSSFDPLLFSVNVVFEIDAAPLSNCLAGSGWVGTGAGCSVSLYSAVAKVVDNNQPGNPFIYIPFVTSPLSSIITDIYVLNNQPAGIRWDASLANFIVDTTPPFGSGSLPVPGTPPTGTGTPDPNLVGTWALSFFNLEDLLNTPSPGPSYDSTAFLSKQCTFNFFACPFGWNLVDTAAVITTGSFHEGFKSLPGQPLSFADDGTPLFAADQVVPEPSSIALVLGALGAGLLTRRRKTAVSGFATT